MRIKGRGVLELLTRWSALIYLDFKESIPLILGNKRMKWGSGDRGCGGGGGGGGVDVDLEGEGVEWEWEGRESSVKGSFGIIDG